jgi:hypothetical protein
MIACKNSAYTTAAIAAFNTFRTVAGRPAPDRCRPVYPHRPAVRFDLYQVAVKKPLADDLAAGKGMPAASTAGLKLQVERGQFQFVVRVLDFRPGKQLGTRVAGGGTAAGDTKTQHGLCILTPIGGCHQAGNQRVTTAHG